MPFKHNVILDFHRLDNNQHIIAGTGYPDYKILDCQGLTGLEMAYTTTTNPQVPGYPIQTRRAEARVIDVQLDCEARLRQRAIAFFNPEFPIHLTVEWNGTKRWILCYANPVKVVTENIYQILTLHIQLRCPSPFLNDMSDFGQDITWRQPLLAFPFVLLKDRGLIPSYRVPTNDVKITNAGHVPVPVRVLFQAYGDAQNPRVVLNDSLYIQVNVDLHAGDILDINTDPRGIYVRLNGRSILNRTDRTSTYFQIPVGQSKIGYQAGDEFDALSATVYFTQQYLGV